ncbi:hypothetical protein MBCUT_15590 [Methanobrevibacter cuticularis]|uniref:Uncharacterized protein n=1 Tax=Methanobrevibacter cuticularis TaxID=47311 RepID=A0A166D9H5_9EURY|nr:hypothetical protein [Methanobrevibacter cuticularis]KZX15345.1 hypothetical protein MBCUT_15590 [Methanobrevibacter cuticularis]
MNQKTLNLMEEAISTAGKLTWLEIAETSIQFEFEDVQLYKPTLNDKDIHSTQIAIRLGDNAFFSIFSNDNFDNNDIWHILSKNFPYKINKNEFRFQDFGFLEKIANDYKYEKNLLGNSVNDINNAKIDFVICFVIEKMAITAGANQLHFFDEFEVLNQESIKKLSNQWWIYWMDYWKKKGTSHEYNHDPACEAIRFK